MTGTEMLTAVLPDKKKKIDVDSLRSRLEGLGLTFAAQQLPQLLAEAVQEDLGPTGLLEHILGLESEQREERRVRMGLRLSGLPTGQTIANFDFAFQPSVERSRIEALATCAWIARGRSLLLLGPPGVGKTHLAIALGVRAVESGFSVAFYRLEELLYLLSNDDQVPPGRLRRKKYMKAGLLIVDEMGFQPLSHQDANRFFRLVSYRYERGSICITSNRAIREWPEMFAGDEAITAAILDRLLHNSHVLSIRGRSYRLRELEDLLQQQDTSKEEKGGAMKHAVNPNSQKIGFTNLVNVRVP